MKNLPTTTKLKIFKILIGLVLAFLAFVIFLAILTVNGSILAPKILWGIWVVIPFPILGILWIVFRLINWKDDDDSK